MKDVTFVGLAVIGLTGFGTILCIFAPYFEQKVVGLFMGYFGFWLLGRYIR